MTGTFRALCAEVLAFNNGEGLYNFSGLKPYDRDNAAFDAWRDIRQRLKSALAQPEPQGLTKQEAQELFNSIRVPIIERLTPGGDEEIVGYEPVQPVDFARAVLARCCGCSTNNDPS
jgi:hypothetical protein